MKHEVKPSFSKEYANKVGKADFVEHFEKVYPGIDLESEWEKIQDKKEVKEAKEEKPKK